MSKTNQNNRGLRTRVAISNAVDLETMKMFDELSDLLKVPKSKLLDEAIMDLLIKKNFSELKKQESIKKKLYQDYLEGLKGD